jgi:hypothetical protein
MSRMRFIGHEMSLDDNTTVIHVRRPDCLSVSIKQSNVMKRDMTDPSM